MSLLSDTYATRPAKRSLHTANYTFATHPDWKPSGNCSNSHCMLQAGAPTHKWTLVGNGSYKGAHHDLHFLHTGTNVAYQAVRSGSSGSHNNISERANPHVSISAILAAKPGKTWELAEFEPYENSPKPYSKVLADLAAVAAMESAMKGFTVSCQDYKDNSTSLNNSDNMAEGVMDITFPTVGTIATLSSATVNNWVATCATEAAARRTFIIYPEDGLDVDSLSSLLASFEDANVATQLSTNLFGVLFWRADLTPAQVIKVTQEKQGSDRGPGSSP